jgi:hypothetical protein
MGKFGGMVASFAGQDLSMAMGPTGCGKTPRNGSPLQPEINPEILTSA